MARVWAIPAMLMLVACKPRPEPVLAWRFEARRTSGEVRVLPVIALHKEPLLALDSFLGRGLSDEVEAQRRLRTQELVDVPEAIGLALPGAVNGILGRTWDGQFRYSSWPLTARDRVEAALEGSSRRLDGQLGRAARTVGGDAVLITWVDALDARPLTAEGFAGDIVETTAGPAVVDHADEPYHVEVDVGMALVAADGEVVLRYHDAFEALLSSRMPPSHVGRVVAAELASEIGKVWATDPALEEGKADDMAQHPDGVPRGTQSR